MINTHFKGKITELIVAQKFLEKGIQVSQPLVFNSRYDFIVDINNKLLKIQVKTAKISDDKAHMSFATSTSHTNTHKTINRTYQANEIDYFATIVDEECYIIPYNICGKRGQRLRLKNTKNNQKQNILFAKDFTLEKFLIQMGH